MGVYSLVPRGAAAGIEAYMHGFTNLENGLRISTM